MKKINKIFQTYIKIAYGYKIEDKAHINKIKRIIGYLLDNDYNSEMVMFYLLENGEEIIEEKLYNNVLTKPNTFYYHNKLRITSKPASWNPESVEKSDKFFLEMRFNFSMNDLLDYYYSELRIMPELRDSNRDSKALQYLLDKYKFKDWDSLDFILVMIDIISYKKSSDEPISITKAFDIEKVSDEAYNQLSMCVMNNKIKNIIWRDYYGM